VRQAEEARGDYGIEEHVESSIGEEYLQQRKENQEGLNKLTAPSDIEAEHSLVKSVITWRQQGIAK
jgi:hypothetical protein